MIITKPNLFQQALIAPAVDDGCNHLLALSGYASPHMVDRHFEELHRLEKPDVSVTLLVGMTLSHRVEQAEHNMFRTQTTERYPGYFRCFYKARAPVCHSKVYVWLKNNQPKVAWLGSANYTQPGFSPGHTQLEILASVNPKTAHEHVMEVRRNCIPCDGPGPFRHYIAQHFGARLTEVGQLPSVELPLTARSAPNKGKPHPRAGLNWGQRPGRDQNQAYIPIPAKVRRAGFFPERKQRFTLITDDKKSFVCAVAQDDGKAIHTTESNAIFGTYFRRRLGVQSGAPVTEEHLKKYGRDSVTVYKKDDETFYMDFSP